MASFKSCLIVAILAINECWVATATLSEAFLNLRYPGLYSEGTCPTLQPITDFRPQDVSKICTNAIFFNTKTIFSFIIRPICMWSLLAINLSLFIQRFLLCDAKGFHTN